MQLAFLGGSDVRSFVGSGNVPAGHHKQWPAWQDGKNSKCK
jgi:hypothetical protein